MKKEIVITILLILVFVTHGLFASDPNTPIVPPKPGIESVSVVDAETLRITTSVDIKKAKLLSQKAQLVQEIEERQQQIAVIDVKLAKLK